MKCSLLTAVSAAWLLTACSHTSAPVRVVAPQNVISYDVLELLVNLVPGQSAQLAVSPWGDNIDVVLLQRYRAATGFDCMRLKLANTTALTCQIVDTRWVVEPTFI